MIIKTNQKKFWAYNDIFDVLGNTLKPTGIAVYLCLIRHADRNAQCYPSHKLIATKCGISRRTVITTISKLVKLDLIKVQKRETDNGGDTSNLYIIKELANHIHTEKKALPPAPEIHKKPEKIAHPPVQNLHTPCEKVAHPPVQDLHTPCENIAHKGQLTEGKLYLKDDDTKDEQPINNHSNCNTNRLSSFNEELSELNSPINLSQQAVKALSLLPDNNKRQEVLDVLAASMKKGTIRKPEAYLQTFIQRSLEGNLTPIQKITSKNNTKNNDNCCYCNNTGKIQFKRPDGSITLPLDCKHGNEARIYIEKVKRDYGYDFINPTSKIESIAKTIENPSSTSRKIDYANIAKKIPPVNVSNDPYPDIPF
jgi:predicted transcriptional regulator